MVPIRVKVKHQIISRVILLLNQIEFGIGMLLTVIPISTGLVQESPFWYITCTVYLNFDAVLSFSTWPSQKHFQNVVKMCTLKHILI